MNVPLVPVKVFEYVKGEVSYFVHMLLRIANLKALDQRLQVYNPKWRPQRKAKPGLSFGISG